MIPWTVESVYFARGWPSPMRRPIAFLSIAFMRQIKPIAGSVRYRGKPLKVKNEKFLWPSVGGVPPRSTLGKWGPRGSKNDFEKRRSDGGAAPRDSTAAAAEFEGVAARAAVSGGGQVVVGKDAGPSIPRPGGETKCTNFSTFPQTPFPYASEREVLSFFLLFSTRIGLAKKRRSLALCLAAKPPPKKDRPKCAL